MPNERIQNLLIVVLIVVVVILASLLFTGINRMTAQARSVTGDTNLTLASDEETGGVIGEQQGVGVSLSYQGVFTEEVETLDNAIPMVMDGDPNAPVIGGQSTSSGVEFIPASSFRYDGFSGPNNANGYRYWPTGGYIRNNSALDICLSAPVYVPDGATLTEASIYVMDDYAPTNLGLTVDSINFRRKNLASPTTAADNIVLMAIPGTVDDTIVRRWLLPIPNGNTVAGGENVSNDYGYYISFCFPANSGLDILVYGARVDYTLP